MFAGTEVYQAQSENLRLTLPDIVFKFLKLM
jgi:hypothetical protein